MLKYLAGLMCCAAACLGADVKIILPDDPQIWEKKAAADLRKYLSESVEEKITVEGQPAEFHVGETALAKSLGQDLREEEWCIKNVGGRIVLFGGGHRGTIYAVSVFLERYAGILLFSMHEKEIPHRKELCLPKLNLQGKPAFPIRAIFPDYSEKWDDGDFAAFNRLNSFGDRWISAANGGGFRYGSPYSVHTFNRYVPEAEFFQTHPEYFSLTRKGNRNPNRLEGQLCLSNPELVEVMWKKLQGFILADEAKAEGDGSPAPGIYDISQNDNNSFCVCERCSQLRAYYGNAESGLQLNLINQLARKLKLFRPDLKISTLAYFQTEAPPRNITLEDNIVIRLCNTANNFVGGPEGAGEEPFRQRLKDWGGLTDSLGIWDYGISFNGFARGLPYPSEFFLQETLRYYRVHNVLFPFVEREYIYHTDMAVMKTWLHAKLMEVPDADFDALLNTFLNGYYGKAAPFIRQYRLTLLASVREKKPFITAFMPSAFSFTHLDCKTVSACDKLLEQAESSVQDDPVRVRRVREARAGIDEAIVLFIRKFNLEDPGHGLDPRIAAKRLKETLRTSIETCIDRKRQAYCLAKIAKMEVYDILPETIPPQNEVPGGIDIPIELASWWAGGEPLVKDPESPLGYAVRVRQGALPVLIGGYDQQTRSEHFSARITGEEIKGPGYHWYTIGETFRPRPAGYIYLTNKWFVQFPQSPAWSADPDSPWRIHVSMKFTGPAYPGGKAEDSNAIFIDRIVLEPVLHP